MSARKPASTYSINEEMVRHCDLSFAVSLIDARWKLQIISSLESGKQRFTDIKREFPQITDRMLAMQLRALEKDGLIKRIIIEDTPLRAAYELSETGRQLIPILGLLSEWGAKHRSVASATVHP